MFNSGQPWTAPVSQWPEWDLKLLGDKDTTRSFFSFSDISDKKAQDDKDTKTKKKKQKKEKNEDDDESSKKDKDDKKDKKKTKKGKVRVFAGEYLFLLIFFDFLGRFHIEMCRAATSGYRTTEICSFVDDIIPTLSVRVFVGTCCVIYSFFSLIERLILSVAW